MSESLTRSQERVALATPYGRTDGLTEILSHPSIAISPVRYAHEVKAISSGGVR